VILKIFQNKIHKKILILNFISFQQH